MVSPETEKQFNGIFEGIKSKVNMRKLLKIKDPKKRFKAFKNAIQDTNLKSLKDKNKKKLFGFFLSELRKTGKGELKDLRKKVKLSKGEQNRFKKIQDFLNQQKQLTDFEKETVRFAQRARSRFGKKEELAETLEEKNIDIKFIPTKKVGRGRPPEKEVNTLIRTRFATGTRGFRGIDKAGRTIKAVKTKTNRILIYVKGTSGIKANLPAT